MSQNDIRHVLGGQEAGGLFIAPSPHVDILHDEYKSGLTFTSGAFRKLSMTGDRD